MESTVLAVTGHRPQKLGGFGPTPLARAVAARIGEVLDEMKPLRCISGMALGVDQWFAWLAVKRSVPFTAAVPFEGQEIVWRQEQQTKYRELLSKAAEKIVLYDRPTNRADASGKLNGRNRWMVDHCTVLLAVWDGSSGGTSNCVKYAEKAGRRIVRIDPRLL